MDIIPRSRALVPHEEPTTFGDLVLKMDKLRQLSDAILRARKVIEERKTYFYSAAYTDLLKQREALLKTLPPLRLVVSNG